MPGRWLLVTSVFAACSAAKSDGGGAMLKLKVESEAFSANGEIPAKHTCEGANISPPLRWSGLPEGTRSVALILDDPDAPDPARPKMTWVHWVLYDLPPAVDHLALGLKAPPAGGRSGKNNWKRTGYGGPCPPVGRHRYFHKVFALDQMLGDLGEPTKAELEAAMAGHVLARGELIGTYQKNQKKQKRQ